MRPVRRRGAGPGMGRGERRLELAGMRSERERAAREHAGDRGGDLRLVAGREHDTRCWHSQRIPFATNLPTPLVLTSLHTRHPDFAMISATAGKGTPVSRVSPVTVTPRDRWSGRLTQP